MSVLSFIEWNSCVCLVFQEAMEKMAKVGKVVQPDSEVQRWGILQQERKRLTLMPSLCLIIDLVVGYFRNEIWNIQQASNLSHDFLYFFLFFQLLWEEVQGVPATARPPEGVPGPHEPEMTVLVGGVWDEAHSLWHNSDDKSRTRRLNLAAFFSINNVF